ncbi:hypothetical protein IAS59_000053 [Cryptococcus gattii]
MLRVEKTDEGASDDSEGSEEEGGDEDGDSPEYLGRRGRPKRTKLVERVKREQSDENPSRSAPSDRLPSVPEIEVSDLDEEEDLQCYRWSEETTESHDSSVGVSGVFLVAWSSPAITSTSQAR